MEFYHSPPADSLPSFNFHGRWALRIEFLALIVERVGLPGYRTGSGPGSPRGQPAWPGLNPSGNDEGQTFVVLREDACDEHAVRLSFLRLNIVHALVSRESNRVRPMNE